MTSTPQQVAIQRDWDNREFVQNIQFNIMQVRVAVALSVDCTYI
jgi:hypothetical protein